MRPKPSSSESDECRSFEYHRHSWQESTPTFFFFSKFGIDRQQEYPFHRYPRLLNISPNDFFVRFRLNKLECSNYSFLSFGYILSSTFLILRPRSFIFPPFSLSLFPSNLTDPHGFSHFGHVNQSDPISNRFRAMHFHLSKREGVSNPGYPSLNYLYSGSSLIFARLSFLFLFFPPVSIPESAIVLIQDSSLYSRSLWLDLRLGYLVTLFPSIILDRHYHEFLAGFRRCLTRIDDGSVLPTAENRAKLTSSG